jgi:hypothetical protein
MGDLKAIVEELAGRPDRERLAIIKRKIRDLGLFYEEQTFLAGLHSNLFVDIPYKENGEKRVIIASHYDKVSGSPGANDNASAVAAALGVARYMLENGMNSPVRIAFFDLEEYNVFTKALYGSRKYISRNGVDNASCVLNFELVGEGTVPIFWPVRNQSAHYIAKLEKAAQSAGTPAHFVDDIIMNTGDHQSFAEAGLSDSVCMTMGCEEDRILLDYAECVSQEQMLQNPENLYLLNQQIFNQTKTFRHYHKKSDSSDAINEESLVIARDIAIQLIKQH